MVSAVAILYYTPDFITVGKNSLVPDATKIIAGYGSYIVTYDRDTRINESRVGVRRSFSF